MHLLYVGARPRTLPAAVVPVVVGAAAVESISVSSGWRILGALVVSVSLQVAVNYANDYSDGIRGTDNNRVGPLRLVGSGLVRPSVVKKAAFSMIGVAAVVGLMLAAVTSWWILLVGLCAMVATWTYTGGPRPYGYAGLGEVFVFLFFGVIATVGTQFVISEQITAVAVLASIAVGSFACALLVVNNLRDRRGDELSNKKTLAVKMGDQPTRVFFVSLFVVAAVAVLWVAILTNAWVLLGWCGCIAVIPGVREVLNKAEGARLIRVLEIVGKAQLVFGASFSFGLFIALG
ncbi:MAG: hypothetical protein RIR69_137 [Actinomycetota bacterium]|jgi:1,4-dihydroxy-2-naphthoate octaprenyltransferase